MYILYENIGFPVPALNTVYFTVPIKSGILQRCLKGDSGLTKFKEIINWRYEVLYQNSDIFYRKIKKNWRKDIKFLLLFPYLNKFQGLDPKATPEKDQVKKKKKKEEAWNKPE